MQNCSCNYSRHRLFTDSSLLAGQPLICDVAEEYAQILPVPHSPSQKVKSDILYHFVFLLNLKKTWSYGSTKRNFSQLSRFAFDMSALLVLCLFVSTVLLPMGQCQEDINRKTRSKIVCCSCTTILNWSTLPLRLYAPGLYWLARFLYGQRKNTVELILELCDKRTQL